MNVSRQIQEKTISFPSVVAGRVTHMIKEVCTCTEDSDSGPCSDLHVNQHVLNNPATFAARAQSAVTSVARRLVWVLFQQKLPSPEKEKEKEKEKDTSSLFFVSSTPQFDVNTRSS